MKGLFYKFPKNIAHSFSGLNLLWQALAIALTYIIVKTGFDWEYFISVRSVILNEVMLPALIIGAVLPVVVPVCLLVIGKMRGEQRLIITGWALGQAAIIAGFIAATYKAFTGRIPPNMFDTASDISHGFQFGWLEHGVFWGWPSSHTTIAFAMALALITLYPKNRKSVWATILYAFYIGLGVSVSVHWFSEFVAGAIIGSVIGVVVGRSFKEF